ncbi:hypothetical protein TNCV_1971321 [Trichonephila clavipes]|uniref:Uncharacterized protein n=1 Tax=Trichonephila clavipes TaxID=2585209 RepID=A0A8X6W5D7_TRICX|nr:hypothetical protein TNCV_1971321 [Trichonephila clavipes]
MALSVLSNNTSLVYDANLVLNFVPEMTDFLIVASFSLIALTVDSPKLKCFPIAVDPSPFPKRYEIAIFVSNEIDPL